MSTPKHVFISYSRHDLEITDKIVGELEHANIPVWIDREGIRHQDPSFEQEIRKALGSAFAAVLIASPDSFASSFVQGELDYINAKKVPLFVVWVAGEHYIDSVPSYLSRQTYIDARAEQLADAQNHLVEQVQTVQFDAVPRMFACNVPDDVPRSHMTIKLRLGDQIAVDPARYADLHDLLNDLYLNHLSMMFPAFSYSSQWLLATDSGRIRRAALPWSWLVRLDENLTASQNDPTWMDTPLSAYGLLPRTAWVVLEAQQQVIFGVLSNDHHLIDYIHQLGDIRQSKHAAVRLEKYILWEGSKPRSPQEVTTTEYQSQVILLTGLRTLPPHRKHLSGNILAF